MVLSLLHSTDMDSILKAMKKLWKGSNSKKKKKIEQSLV